MNAFLRWSFVIALAAASSISKADDTSALLTRLNAAAAQSSLDEQDLKPWHLKVDFQMFDKKGKPGEQGTMEEWWSEPKLYKLVFTSPSYSATEIHNQDGIFRSPEATPLPYALQTLERAVLHPMPTEDELANSHPILRRETIAKIKMDCIMLGQPIKDNPSIPLGLFPTYCMEKDQNLLRISYDAGMLEIVRARIGTFQQRTVAVDFFVADGEGKLLNGHVAALTTDMTGATFAPAQTMKKVVADGVVRAASGVVAGLKLSGPPPVYPPEARQNHITGSVVMVAIIGVDGHISQLKVISTPSGELAISALVAVHQWVYRPYLLNGVPTNVMTTITVNYQISP